MKYFGLLIFLLFLTVPHIPAQEKKTEQGKYTLADLVERALSNSDYISSYKARVEGKRFAAMQARAWQNPSLDISGGKKYLSDGGPFSSGPSYGVALTQPFYFPGKQELRAGIIDLEADVENVRQRDAELSVTVDVVRLAYEYTFNREKVKFVEERQKRFELIRSFLTSRPFASPQKKAESRIVESRIRNLTADGLRSQAELNASLERINLYVALKGGDYPDIELPRFNGKRIPDKEYWLSKAIENNLDVSAQKLLVTIATKETELAKKEALPDFAVSTFYDESRTQEREKTMGIGISLPLPIFNQNEKGIRSAEKNIQAEKSALDFQYRQLDSSLSALLVELEMARKRVLQYHNTLLSTMENELKETDEEFRKGRVDLLVFLELDTETSETFNRVLEAHYLLMEKVTTLFLLSGERNIISELTTF
ncbi:MAG: hypothetical protein A2W23_04490 [Planctomycetes bacterium RBG_16_43_13]|nr:MAG: hypothetical protein A2W23_04490 [Planctomycetes bacterium RBG_16_43_13]